MCSHSPERRGGIALVPIAHDIERGVEEVEWLAGQPGIRGVMIPTMWRDRLPYNDAAYDPVWAACEAAGFPVHTHSGEAPREEMGEHIGIYLAEVVWWATRPMWHLLFSGAFERFPGLKFVVTEAAAYWVHRHDVEVGPVPGGRAHDQEDGRPDEGQDLQAAVGLLRLEHLHRGVDHVARGDPAPSRHRL